VKTNDISAAISPQICCQINCHLFVHDRNRLYTVRRSRQRLPQTWW